MFSTLRERERERGGGGGGGGREGGREREVTYRKHSITMQVRFYIQVHLLGYEELCI